MHLTPFTTLLLHRVACHCSYGWCAISACCCRQGEVPERCTPEVMRAVFRQHLESPTMWTIFPIQVPGIAHRLA